ncbi:hypothetical protein MJD09_07815, partial [bacterium]|nr:hypothetical protein [bacterium]
MHRERLKFQEALKIHEKAYQLDPLSTLLLNMISLDQQALARYDEALRTKERIVEVDKASRFGYPNLVEHYLSIDGDVPKAIEIGLSISDELYDEVPGLYSLMKSSYLAMGDLERAEAYFDQYVQASGDSSAILDLYWYANDYDRVRDYLDRLKAKKSTFSNNKTIAFYECQLGHYSTAMEYYQKAFPGLTEDHEVKVRNYDHATAIAFVYKKLGETEKAISLAKNALQFYQQLPRFGWPFA